METKAKVFTRLSYRDPSEENKNQQHFNQNQMKRQNDWRTPQTRTSFQGKQSSVVAVFSKKDDVEIISTPESIDLLFKKAQSFDDYEIQMIIYDDPNKKNMTMPQQKPPEENKFFKQLQNEKKILQSDEKFRLQTAYIVNFILEH